MRLLKQMVNFKLRYSVLAFGFCLLVVGVSQNGLALSAWLKVLNDDRRPMTYATYDTHRTYPPGSSQDYKNEFGKVIEVNADERGFRNPQASTLKDAEIVLLGDSFLTAVGTEYGQTLPQHLRRLGYKVYNAGMDGSSTGMSLILLEQIASGLKSSGNVHVLLFLHNSDFYDNFKDEGVSFRATANENSIEGAKDASSAIDIRKRNFISKRIHNMCEKFDLCQWVYEEIWLNRIRGLNKVGRSAFFVDTFSVKAPDHLVEAKNKTEDMLRAFLFLSKRYTFEPVVVLLPNRVEVFRSWLPMLARRDENIRGIVKSAARNSNLNFEQANAHLREVTSNAGVDTVNLLDAFRRAPDIASLYGVYDGHWSGKGQKLAAKIIDMYFSNQK